MSSPLDPNSTVCALVPHFECQEWLADTLESLKNQTRPLDAIVVMDDASSTPPIDIVERFPGVTLVVSADNGGPDRLVQTVIEATAFDAYMFQDADDWSAPERLELLLDAAADTGAELVGSHEARIQVDTAEVEYVHFPLDVNAAMAEHPTAHALLHPTSIVSRSLVQRIGGFATGMRLSGDSEFLQRAVHASRVVNIDHFPYFRRNRPGSMTNDPATALRSAARAAEEKLIWARARANAAAVAAGKAPNLQPYQTTQPARLTHAAGPRLGVRSRTAAPLRAARSAEDAAVVSPLFVIGPPRAGKGLLAAALGQSLSLRLLTECRSSIDEALPGAESPLSSTAGDQDAWVASGTAATREAWNLAERFEAARFVIVSCPASTTAHSLIRRPMDEGFFYSDTRAVQAWVEATRSCLDLELALGAERVLRIDHREMFDDVDGVLRRVLTFANARYDEACTWVFDGVSAPRGAALPTLSARLTTEIAELEQRLLTQVAGSPDQDAARRLRQQRSEFSRSMAVPFVEDFRSFVSGVVPSSAVVAVISRGDEHLVDIPGAVGWHFPQIDGGVYSGSHPADSDEAVQHLEVLRALGAEFLAVPASAFWWFDHYDDFRRHLNSYRMVAYRDSSGVVYALDDTTNSPSHSCVDVRMDIKRGVS